MKLLFVLCFFVLPPVLFRNTSPGIFSNWTFPYVSAFYFVFAILLFISQKKSTVVSHKRKDKLSLMVDTGDATLAFGELCVTAAILEYISYKTGYTSPYQLKSPEYFSEYLFCIMNFAFTAFYEETVYRFYLPSAFTELFSKIKDYKYTDSISECFTVILFALAHSYLGIPAVINAAAGCVILRSCYLKTNSIYTNTSAHFLYNLFVVFIFRQA